MSTVTRYDCITGVEGGPEMDPFGLGYWVAFDDYEKLEAELVALNQRIHDACEVYVGMEGMNPSTHAEQFLLLLLGQMYEALQERGE